MTKIIAFSVKNLSANYHGRFAFDDGVWRSDGFENCVAHSGGGLIGDHYGCRWCDDHARTVWRNRERRYASENVRAARHT